MKKKKIRKSTRSFYAALSYISPRLNTKLLFLRKFGRFPDLKNPQTLNEKILKLKLERYGTDPVVRQCADKYRVRDFVVERGCEDTLTKLIAVYDKVSDIEWNRLPDSFAMKWNFGCGFNIICPDKSKLDIPAAIAQLERWGKEDFWSYYSEVQYRNVEKKIIVEEFLGSESGALPEDYKFYCFNGNPEYVLLCTGREEGWPKFYFFDRDFNLKRFNPTSRNAPEGFTLPKPEGLDAAFEVAAKLSRGFPFVRTDLYLCNGKVYFGEMTFTPAAGLDNQRLPETDRLFGSMVHL